MRDALGTAVSEIRKSGVLVHCCPVVRICDHLAERVDIHLEGTHSKLTRQLRALPSWWKLWFKLEDGFADDHVRGPIP